MATHRSTPVLVPLTSEVVQKRLASEEFSMTPIGLDHPVEFGPEWPGDLLAVFPMFAEAFAVQEGSSEQTDQAVVGQYMIVDADRALVVGAIGTVEEVTPQHTVEIGYGINASEWGRGYAGAALGLFVGAIWDGVALGVPVEEIVAGSAIGNVASRRVLERNGFVRTGAGHNSDDGDLDLWSLHRPA